MKTIITWIGRFFTLILALIFLGIFALVGWALFQPTLPENAQKVGEEYLISEAYQKPADSALTLITQVAEGLKLPSVSVAVSVDNQRVWAVALGYADISEEKWSGLHTRYRAGSVSKSMTGIAAVKLMEQGLLDPEKTIRQYVPAFPQKRWEPTLRQLGAHTGGIRHYSDLGHPAFFQEQFGQKHYTSVEEALILFSQDSLLYEPGTGFLYSTHGFTLLSAAMEKAAGKPYLELVDNLLWEPAHMIHTRPDDLAQNDPQRAEPYTRVMGRMLAMEGPDPSYKWAGGGILTTPTDLVNMGGAFMAGMLNRNGPRDSLFKARRLTDGSPNPQNYAMGWLNGRESELLGISDTVAVLNHGGASPGGSSFILLLPSDTLAVACMTNLSLKNSWPLRETMYKIAGIFREETP